MTIAGLLALALLPQTVSDVPSRFLERTLAAYEALDAGELEHAKRLFAVNFERFPEHANSAYALACIAARSGDANAALDWLAKAVQFGYADADVAAWDSDLAPLRTDARFTALVATMRAQPEAPAHDARLVWNISNDGPSYSSDGTRIVTGRGGDGAILDARTSELIALITYDERGLSGVRVESAGTRAAVSAFDQDVSVWDTFDGRKLWRRNVVGTWASAPEWETSGASLLVNGKTPDSECSRLDAATGVMLASFGRAPEGAWLSPDGTRVFTLRRTGERSSTGELFDARTTASLARLAITGMPMYQGGFNASGKFLWCASAEAGEVHVFDALDGREVAVLRGTDGKLTLALALPDRDELITTGGGRGLAWWDMATGEVVRSSGLADAKYGSIHASPNGDYLLTNTWGDALRVLDARTGEELWQLDTRNSSRWMFGGAFRGDGEQLALPFGDRLSIYESRTGRELGERGAPSLDVGAPALHPDGTRALIPCGDGTLRLLELATGRTLASWKPRAVSIETCAWSADGKRALVSWSDGTFGWLDGTSGATSMLVERSLDVAWVYVTASADGRRVIVRTQGGDALLFDGESGAELAKLGPAGWGTVQVIHDATRTLAAAQADGVVALFDLDTGARRPREFRTDDAARSLAFSPDGSALACGTVDKGLFVWRIEDGAVLRQLQVPDAFDASLDVRDLAFVDEGRALVFTTGDYGTVRRLDVATGDSTMLHDTSGGNGGTIRARPNMSGERLYVHGMTTGNQPVIDARSGKPLLDLGKERLGFVAGTRDDRWVVGTVHHAVRVFGERLDARYSYVPFDDDGWIAKSESLHCAGTAAALRWAVIVIGDETYPFASFASELLDPKRVRAAAAGVKVRPAMLGEPPKARVVGDAIRGVGVADDSIDVRFEATDPLGLVCGELELDGKAHDWMCDLLALSPPSLEPREWSLQLGRTRGAGTNELRIVVYSRSGLGSRPVRVRFVASD